MGYVWGRGDAAAALLPPAPAPAERGAGEQAAAAAADAAETDATAAGALEGSPAAATATATGAGDDGGRSHAAGLPPAPAFDVITAADVVYEPERYAELAAVLRQLAAPHTLVYLAFKRRGERLSTFSD